MKSYLEIPGYREAPNENCTVFYKYDGSNLRAEWSRKTGWYKFGTRTVLIDKHSPFADAIDIFKNTYGDSIAKIFTDNPLYKKVESIVAYCEYFGKNSFAGQHDPNDTKEVVLIDVNIHKKGFMGPDAFTQAFKDIKVAEVLWRGKFDQQLVEAVQNRSGIFDIHHIHEGVVAKGIISGKSPQHSLWMAKIKTKWWLEELKRRAEIDPSLKSVLADNVKEQAYVAKA